MPKHGKRFSTFEQSQPWVCYHYGRTHDSWWPPLHSTRWLGYAIIVAECAVCGVSHDIKIAIPRFGPVIDRGAHPKRRQFLRMHEHPDRGPPMLWAKPLLNPSAL